ncbi:hypothetical protein [Novosphingobium sp. EMRT-2]|uniref:hypothetical protein n=1 Tax=Novosphingobium sp. EMRT-2 TaxID=2571749 RepID=UPI0010BDAE90|nr:hypothetical protein [Novosphingobium sp. EMRT-2]QCI93366.1 hypothetical protein FA702_07235 [Novosphingobium sp. EMRT-2]
MEGDIREKFSGSSWLKALERLRLSNVSRNWRVFEDPKRGVISVAHGYWILATEFDDEGQCLALLHENLAILHEVFGFDAMLYERSLTPEQRGGRSNEANDVLIELNGHAKSFYFAYRRAGLMRTIQGIHRASWQTGFLGGVKRGTKRKELTELYVDRAREYGFVFRKPDEAAALGILTYGMLSRKEHVPWVLDEVLRPMAEARA